MIKTILGNIRYIRSALQTGKAYTWSILLLNAAASSIAAAKVLTIGRLIDGVLRMQALGIRHMMWDACLIILVYLLEYVLAALQKYLHFRFCIRLNNRMEDTFYHKLASVRYAVLEDNDSNDLIFHVKDGIEKKFADGFSQIMDFLGFLFRAGSILFVVITKNAATGLILLLVLICLGPLYQKIGEDNYQAYVESNKEFRRAKSYLQILSDREYAEEREIFGYSAFFNAKWRAHYQSGIEKERKASRQQHCKILLVTNAVTLLTTLLSCIMIPALLKGTLSLGVYVMVVTQLFDLVHFMSWNFSYIMENLSENKLYLDDFDAFMELDVIQPAKKEAGISRDRVSIQVENLSFRYPGSEDFVLKNFSFTFQEGKHYAIVGKNGAGKTTLVKLLLGLYEEYEGRILLNGTELRQLSREEISSFFSVVFQDYGKYALTVKENILLKHAQDPQKSRQAERILAQLGISEEISRLSKGIDTPLGKINEDGADLSGGQWQKLAIARGAVSDALVYILDEPSSSLDPISEKRLYALYDHIFEKYTTITITHRLGNTKGQDEILVLDGGTLAEYGPHEALMAHRSVYYEMFTRQRSWYHAEEPQ